MSRERKSTARDASAAKVKGAKRNAPVEPAAIRQRTGVMADEAPHRAEPLQIAPPAPAQIALSDIALPLTSRAVFWQPRHPEKSRSLRHVPFLFWLMETIRPARVVSLGLTDPVAFLSLCQAVDKLGLDAVCMGVDLSTDKRAMTGAMADQLVHLYGDFAFVVTEDFTRAAHHVQNGQIDLLVIDAALGDEQVMALRAQWMPLLSERAVLVVHDPATHLAQAEGRQWVDSLIRARPGIRFPQAKPGLEVVLLGVQQPERLTRMAALDLGMPGYLAAWQVFARLGEGLESAQIARARLGALNKATAGVQELEARLDAVQADLAQERDARQAALDSEAAQVAEVAGLQAQIFDLQSALAKSRVDPALKSQVAALETALSAEAEKRKAHWQKAESLAAEKAALETALKEETERRRSNFRKFEAATAEKAALDKAMADLQAKVDQTAAEVAQARRDADEAEARRSALQAQRDDDARQHEAALSEVAALTAANARLQDQLRQMTDKRLAIWEAHETLKAAHATLLARLSTGTDAQEA